MALNKIPNSTVVDAFIAKNGRPPEMKNPDDIQAIADGIRHNLIMAMDSTDWYGYHIYAAKAAIIDYWKAKRLEKVA
jgi:hypothetical protein